MFFTRVCLLYLLVQECAIVPIAGLSCGVSNHVDALEVVADGKEEGQVVATDHIHGQGAKFEKES